MRLIVSRTLRLVVAAALAWCVAVALAAPEIPLLTRAAALLTLVVSAWRPAYALIALAALTPAGLLLAPPPARGADLLAWAFLAGWSARVWRPLAARGWPPAITLPAVLYAACAVASWLAIALADAAGVAPAWIGAYLANAVGGRFLVFSTPAGETWTALQIVVGIAVLLAASAVARTEAALLRRVAWAVASSLAVLAVLTCVDVWRQWSTVAYDVDYLLRYTRGERFTLHLADLNAAGSQYVLAAGIAIAAVALASRRWLAALLLALMLPAFYLTGSRSALVGVAAAVATLAAVRRTAPWRIDRRYLLAGVATVAVAGAAVAAVAAFGSDEPGSAGRALHLRTQFLQTSVRMIASEPVFGVGVGRYFERSTDFMPTALRDLYGAENAHNYFAQQVAELGLLVGGLFLGLIAAAAVAAWRAARAPAAPPGTIALFAGCAGYLLTCVTGHPLLVMAAALPFWIALGTLVAAAPDAAPARVTRPLAVAVAALLLVSVARGALAWHATETMPAERGFDRPDVADDGRRVRWTSPHVVTYIPSGAGFLRMTMRAPDRAFARPVVVETTIAGRQADHRELPRGEWVTVEIPVRIASDLPFRRVDLRVTPTWTEPRTLGRRTARVEVALGVMVAEVRWIPAQRR